MKNSMQKFFAFVLLSTLAVLQGGCGLLLGNIKPVEEKSVSYGISDLSHRSLEWVKLEPSPPKSNGERPGSSDVSDVAFQSKKTAAIISLNSACRPTHETTAPSLKELTDQLLLGMQKSDAREEKEFTLHGTPSLQTTIQGMINQEAMTLRSIVLRKNNCVYDLMYISRPERFAEHEQTFAQFVASLRLRD